MPLYIYVITEDSTNKFIGEKDHNICALNIYVFYFTISQFDFLLSSPIYTHTHTYTTQLFFVCLFTVYKRRKREELQHLIKMMNYLHFAIYDDLIANFFLDKLFLWFSTTRVNVNYNMPDTDRKSGISILREYLVYGRTNVSGAVEAFLRYTLIYKKVIIDYTHLYTRAHVLMCLLDCLILITFYKRKNKKKRASLQDT